MRAIVVGGGIGGLAAAVALRRTGWDVTVLEQAAEPGEIGAGISLWPNALAALAALDVWPGIRAAAAMQVGGVRRPDGRWLSRTDPGRSPFEVLLVHRGQLWSALRDALPRDALRPGSRVDAVSPDGAVTWDGHSERADLVVAADGLRSAVRARLVPAFGGARYAGFTAWRGVTAEPFALGAAAETWGRGAEFGATIMVDGRVYWFATANLPEGARAADEHAEVLRRFGRWHEPIGGIVRATAPAAVLRHDIYTLRAPLPPFAHGRVALLGDAAHAMTPNLGQGACQALEDAVTLAALLENRTVDEAMRAYDQARRPRTEKLVKMSARVGAMLQTENRALIAARNLSARVIPPELAGRGMTKLIGWTAPNPSSVRSA